MKIIMKVDYDDNYHEGDEAPPELAEKLVKAGLARRVYESKKAVDKK